MYERCSRSLLDSCVDMVRYIRWNFNEFRAGGDGHEEGGGRLLGYVGLLCSTYNFTFIDSFMV